MRTRSSLCALTVLLGAAGCDNVDAGRLTEDTGPPRILRILVQDGSTYPGRVVDLLNTAPQVACSDANPCTAGTTNLVPTCVPTLDAMGKPAPDGAGICDDPTHADKPVSVGMAGLVQVRIVLSKILDGLTVESSWIPDGGTVDDRQFQLKTPTAFQLFGPNGMEVAGTKYYDPTGSAYDTGDPIGEPLGPALVINADAALLVSSKYTVKIDPSTLKDKSGNAITDTSNGAINPAGYTFTTENFYVAGVMPEGTGKVPLAPNDVIQFATNADVDESSISGTVTIPKMNGQKVNVAWWLDRGSDPAACAPNPRMINVFPVDLNGAPMDWPANTDFSITLAAKDADSGTTALTDGPGSKSALSSTFSVNSGPPGDPKKDAQAVKNHVLPNQCMMAPTPDMAMPGPVDMSVID